MRSDWSSRSTSATSCLSCRSSGRPIGLLRERVPDQRRDLRPPDPVPPLEQPGAQVLLEDRCRRVPVVRVAGQRPLQDRPQLVVDLDAQRAGMADYRFLHAAELLAVVLILVQPLADTELPQDDPGREQVRLGGRPARPRPAPGSCRRTFRLPGRASGPRRRSPPPWSTGGRCRSRRSSPRPAKVTTTLCGETSRWTSPSGVSVGVGPARGRRRDRGRPRPGRHRELQRDPASSWALEVLHDRVGPARGGAPSRCSGLYRPSRARRPERCSGGSGGPRSSPRR